MTGGVTNPVMLNGSTQMLDAEDMYANCPAGSVVIVFVASLDFVTNGQIVSYAAARPYTVAPAEKALIDAAGGLYRTITS